MMKALIFFFLSAICSAPFLYAEEIQLGDTKDLYKQEKGSERFTWTIPVDRIKGLPIWRKGDKSPISISKAEQIAHNWSRQQPLAGEIPERPYRIALIQFPAPYDNHYYYKVHFATADASDSFWTVHILMDGTIIEPKIIKPNKAVDSTR